MYYLIYFMTSLQYQTNRSQPIIIIKLHNIFMNTSRSDQPMLEMNNIVRNDIERVKRLQSSEESSFSKSQSQSQPYMGIPVGQAQTRPYPQQQYPQQQYPQQQYVQPYPQQQPYPAMGIQPQPQPMQVSVGFVPSVVMGGFSGGVQCTQCGHMGNLRIRKRFTNVTYAWAIALFFLTIVLFWVPFVNDSCQETQYTCFKCGNLVNTHQPRCC